MDHGKADLGILFYVEFGDPIMGPSLADMFPARAPGNDMEFCPLFSDDDIMHMLDLFSSEEEACLDRENIV